MWQSITPSEAPMGVSWGLHADDPRAPWLLRLLNQVPILDLSAEEAEWPDDGEVDPDRILPDDETVDDEVSGFERWLRDRPGL